MESPPFGEWRRVGQLCLGCRAEGGPARIDEIDCQVRPSRSFFSQDSAESARARSLLSSGIFDSMIGCRPVALAVIT
jgi:hypothetical protein